MGGLLNWVGNILFFFVFVTVTENLLPGKKYSRYVRLSAGMVLILLVLKPVTQGFHIEDQIGRWFEAFAFQQEAQDLSREILGIEKQRLDRVIDSYEQAAEAEISAMAEDMGVIPLDAQVVIERDNESRNYGTVTCIRLEVGWRDETDRGEWEKGEGGEGENGERENGGAIQAVNPVNPVTVNLAAEEEQAGGERIREEWSEGEGAEEELAGGEQAGEERTGEEGAGGGQYRETRAGEENTGEEPETGREASGPDLDAEIDEVRDAKEERLEQLRRKVEHYYGLEAGQVEIKFKGR